MNPLKAVRSVARFAKAQKEAYDVWRLAEQAEKNPALYRDAGWWSQLIKASGELLDALPLPKEIREMQFLKNALINWKSTLGGVAAGMSAIAILAHDPSRLSDPVVIGLLGAAWAGLTGKDANVTGGTKPSTPEATLRTN